MLYYYPNRPILIPPDPENPLKPRPSYLRGLESSGKYIAELKWNGDNASIYTDDLPHIWNRSKKRLSYKPPQTMMDELKQFPKGSLINAELMHNKTVTIKNTLIIHCVMMWKGRMIKTWEDSRKIVDKIKEGNHIRKSEVYTKKFWELYQKADGKIIEGLVLKNPKGKFKFSTTPLSDVPWMKKVRKPCKKYQF